MNKGFTLIELVVTIAIIAVLSAVILFSISMYINRGKDSNISSNLAVLVPAGEVWYNGNGNSYVGFCDFGNSVIKNAITQMPVNSNGGCYNGLTPLPTSGNISSLGNPAGVCCYVNTADKNSWVACAREFSAPGSAYCVDSRGMKKEITNVQCTSLTDSSTIGVPVECPWTL